MWVDFLALPYQWSARDHSCVKLPSEASLSVFKVVKYLSSLFVWFCILWTVPVPCVTVSCTNTSVLFDLHEGFKLKGGCSLCIGWVWKVKSHPWASSKSRNTKKAQLLVLINWSVECFLFSFSFHDGRWWTDSLNIHKMLQNSNYIRIL